MESLNQGCCSVVGMWTAVMGQKGITGGGGKTSFTGMGRVGAMVKGL